MIPKFHTLSKTEQRIHGWGTFPDFLVDMSKSYPGLTKKKARKGKPELQVSWIEGNESIIIFGGSGSGKTSSVGNSFIASMLGSRLKTQRSNELIKPGGIILAVKADVIEHAKEMARFTDRGDDMIIVNSENPYNLFIMPLIPHLNENKQPHRDPVKAAMLFSQEAENLAARIAAIGENLSKGDGGGGGGNDKYWLDQAKSLIKRGIEALYIYDYVRLKENWHASKTSTLYDLYKFLESLPNHEVDEQPAPVGRHSPLEILEEFVYPFLAKNKLPDDMKVFFSATWYNKPQKESSTIFSFVQNALSPFQAEPLKSTFCSNGNYSMIDAIEGGKILVPGYDIGTYENVGSITNLIIKLEYYAMVMKRKDPDRPCFMIADEFQFLSTSGGNLSDFNFVQVSRSMKSLNLFMTQNFTGVQLAMGSPEMASNFFGNIATKIFCQQTEKETNNWASEMNQESVIKESVSDGGEGKTSSSFSREVQSSLVAGYFVRLAAPSSWTQYSIRHDIRCAQAIWMNRYGLGFCEFPLFVLNFKTTMDKVFSRIRHIALKLSGARDL